jgi:hypothetical protein
MPFITWDIDYPREYPWLLPLVEAEYSKTLRRAAEGQLAAIGKQYVLADAMASGDTFKSFEISDVRNFGDRMEIDIAPKGDRAKVVEWLEFGRGPNRTGFPSTAMAANILQWAKDKRILPRGEEAAKAFVWAVATTIARDGFEGKFLLEKAETQYARYIKQMFDGASRRVAKQINERLSAGTTPTPE